MKTVNINGKSFELNDSEEKIYDMVTVISSDTVSAEQAKALVAEAIKANKFNPDADETIKSLKDALTAQGLELKAIKEPKGETTKSIREQLEEAMSSDKFKRFKSGEDKTFTLELKSAGTWLISTNVSGTPPVYPPQYIPGVTPIIANAPDIIPLCNVASTTSPLIVWVEKANPDGTVVITDEGALKPLLDFDFLTKSSAAKKYPGKIKVSLEALEDIPFMESEINTELRRAVDLAADTAVMSYIADEASAYTLTSITTIAPNVSDAIRAAMAQIKSVNHMATVAVLNPIDAANMDLQKTDDGAYQLPPFSTGDGQTIKGIRVVESNQIEVGHLLVGDMTKVRVFVYKPFTVTMGWVDDDFEKNLVTMIGETRIHYYIEDAYTSALVYDEISNIKTAIEAI